MSILITDMEMPKNCADCPFGDAVCCNLMPGVPAWWAEYDQCVEEKRLHSHCPLVPIPPHGDLIDRNKLYEKTAEWEAQALHMVEITMNDDDTTEWKRWSTVLTERSAFKFDVADAPTIIPASEESE